ncbi:bile acid:sodium symporter [Luteolibacter sp. SL250]|uniref:bile acid:sodium symporter family protein n=1 Tax=Luteolibacter sp. SL250 TaxID=2995170 RepID=UPI002270F752|nr:bile acid:sodium symporter family protein [Luteolibacter sp. SL250]WAC19491.1 bile acid:sodium symporter [Luteolibacter sp. SL250]
MSANVSWFRANGFLLALIGAVILAFLFPAGGGSGAWIPPVIVTNGGIALILFFQGLSLAFGKVKAGAGNWRLHLVIQAFTFGVFPLLGILLDHIVPWFWSSQPRAIRHGLLFLCVLPSTISSSVVFTAIARGNTAGALFNAALSNIIGVVLTPLLVFLLMRGTGSPVTTEFGPLLLKITSLTLFPFSLGMALRSFVRDWADRSKPWFTRISNAVIVYIVYAAFCDSVQGDIWQKYGAAITWPVIIIVVLLFVGVSWLTHGSCRLLRMNREDRIAAYFCAVKKTLAMGVPLAAMIFGRGSELSLILLPTMLYHPLQLLVNGVLANHWAKQRP